MASRARIRPGSGLLLGAALLPLLLGPVAACTRRPAGSRYALSGRVVAVDAAQGSVTLDHREVPGFMPAMTMPFTVDDPASLAGLAPGDEVTATLVGDAARYRLEGLAVVAKAAPGSAGPQAPAAFAEPVPGTAVPDLPLVDQDGRRFRVGAYRGRALAVTFLFTRCPLPEFCPRLAQGFGEAEALLAADPVLRDRAALLAVSFDPAFDTPAVLKEWGGRFRRVKGPFDRLRFATGTPDDVRALAATFGLDYQDDGGSFTHNLRTGIVDPAGRLVTVRRGSDWTGPDLVAELRKALPDAPQEAGTIR
jgi:protein SCO1/2